MGIIVGRYAGETALNGIEYLLEGPDSSKVKVFENKEAAMAFLKENIPVEVTDQDLEDEFLFVDTNELEDPDELN